MKNSSEPVRFTSFSVRDGGLTGCPVPRPDGKFKEFVVDTAQKGTTRAHADCNHRVLQGESVRCGVTHNRCALQGRKIKVGIAAALNGVVIIDNTAGLNK